MICNDKYHRAVANANTRSSMRVMVRMTRVDGDGKGVAQAGPLRLGGDGGRVQSGVARQDLGGEGVGAVG